VHVRRVQWGGYDVFPDTFAENRLCPLSGNRRLSARVSETCARSAPPYLHADTGGTRADDGDASDAAGPNDAHDGGHERRHGRRDDDGDGGGHDGYERHDDGGHGHDGHGRRYDGHDGHGRRHDGYERHGHDGHERHDDGQHGHGRLRRHDGHGWHDG